jgi:hypothetical protein
MTGNPDERLFASSCVSDLVSALPEYQQFRERTPTQGALIRKHWRKQNVMNEQLVKQYQAKVFTGTGETSIESVVLGEVKQEISNLLDSSAGEVHYEQPNPRTTLVFDRKGGALVGCISEIDLPQSMSIKQTTEWRFAAAGQKAA